MRGLGWVVMVRVACLRFVMVVAAVQVKQDVAAAKALHAEASALPIRDEALLATLQDASTTYCLCGLPQKVADAMTACAECGTLYHLACLGIAREKEPKRLVCPVCAGRAGQRFVWAVRF